jgi:fructose-1,6-bisphosphatase/inositol monophosphatase family enzyme
VKVPLALYQGTPKIRYRTNLVMYDYGSDAIEVRFLADGSVDVIYNSGFLRRW